jgi:hypothetical protein
MKTISLAIGATVLFLGSHSFAVSPMSAEEREVFEKTKAAVAGFASNVTTTCEAPATKVEFDFFHISLKGKTVADLTDNCEKVVKELGSMCGKDNDFKKKFSTKVKTVKCIADNKENAMNNGNNLDMRYKLENKDMASIAKKAKAVL